MKKYLIYTAAAIVAVSCAKSPVPVETPNEEPGAPAVEGNVAIQFSSNLVTNPQTKAAGFVDEWNEQELFIYGFPRKGSPLATDYENPFIDKVSATAPKRGATLPKDKKIDVWKVKPVESEESSTPGEYYYYEGTKTYDFFGYYADGAIQGEPTKDPSGVTASVTITGGEDIMVASASVADAVTAAKGENATEWEEKNPNWNNQYAFSAYAARRGVHPILKFKHLLTQLKFTVTSGGNLAADKLYIKSIKLAGVSNSATLTVAGETLGFSNYGEANSTLSVVSAYGEPNIELASLNDGSGAKVPASTPEPTPTQVGAPIMPFEASSFKILIQLSQEGVAVDPAPIEQTIDMSNVLVPNGGLKPGDSGYTDTFGTSGDKFEAGKAYTINFKLYGLEQVEVTAKLTPWEEGGQIEIDTDTPPDVNPTTPEPEPGAEPEN